MVIKILDTKKLSKILIRKICTLKNQEWSYGLKSNFKWFKVNIYDDDLNFLLFHNTKLVGYNCLRKKNIYDSSRKFKRKKIFIFDSLVIDKRYREKGFSKKLMLANSAYIKKNKLISALLCEDRMTYFYKKFGWKKLKIKKKNVINHKTKLNILSFNINLKNTNFYIYY